MTTSCFRSVPWVFSAPLHLSRSQAVLVLRFWSAHWDALPASAGAGGGQVEGSQSDGWWFGQPGKWMLNGWSVPLICHFFGLERKFYLYLVSPYEGCAGIAISLPDIAKLVGIGISECKMCKSLVALMAMVIPVGGSTHSEIAENRLEITCVFFAKQMRFRGSKWQGTPFLPILFELPSRSTFGPSRPMDPEQIQVPWKLAQRSHSLGTEQTCSTPQTLLHENPIIGWLGSEVPYPWDNIPWDHVCFSSTEIWRRLLNSKRRPWTWWDFTKSRIWGRC